MTTEYTTQEEKIKAVAYYDSLGEYTNKEIADLVGICERSVNYYKKRLKEIDYLSIEPDTISESDPKTVAKLQRLQDARNQDKRLIRESSRQWNCQTELAEAMRVILEGHKLSPLKSPELKESSKAVGIIQLSDIHFNELIHDIDDNRYDFKVASARIKKYIDKAVKVFKSHDISSIAVLMTGDLLNSDRRLDEITAAATNRSNAVFIGVDILQQAIQQLLTSFNSVTVASVTGNESRVGQDNHWGDFLAGDSYDIVIHNMLSLLFKDEPRAKFIPINDPMECVVNVLNTNVLMVHGHGHRGLASTGNIEREVQSIKATYAAKGVKIDYVICGHIHQAYVSDMFSRSSGLPGNNSYSRKALNLNGKSSQNLYIVSEDGSIDGIKVDLQKYDIDNKYDYDDSLESYNKQNNHKTVIIQSVLI